MAPATKACDTSHHDGAMTGARTRDASKDGRDRDDAVIGAEHGGTQPADAVDEMDFGVDGGEVGMGCLVVCATASTRTRRHA